MSSRQISSATNPDFPALLSGPVCAIDRPMRIGGLLCAWALVRTAQTDNAAAIAPMNLRTALHGNSITDTPLVVIAQLVVLGCALSKVRAPVDDSRLHGIRA